MGYVFDMPPKGVPRVPQGLPKDVPEGDFEGRGEYLRWFPPYMKKAPRSADSGAVSISPSTFGEV